MKIKISQNPYWARLGIILVISLVFTLAFNEITYRFQKEPADRSPQTITLVIPPGTAQRIQAGEQVTNLVQGTVFVIGDVLEVKNEDSVSHQLGPVWVPPGTTGTLTLEKVNKGSFACSFQSSHYFGLEVRPATTLGTRLAGLFLTFPTLGALLYLYSLAAYPLRKDASQEPTHVSSQQERSA
jgi:hypothetical protein